LGETWFGSDGQSQIHTQSCLEVVLGTELLGETWFDADGQSQIYTQPCLEGNRVGEETLIRDLVRMGKVRYIPSCVLKAVVLAMKILGETWFGADGQSQIHTQPRLEGSRIGEETLGRDRDRMSRVRYTPRRVLKEAVLSRKVLGETWFGSDGQSQIHTQSCLEVVLATELLRETWFGADGQSQIHTQPCLEASRVGEEALGRDRDRMGRVRYTPRCVLKEVVSARTPFGITGIK